MSAHQPTWFHRAASRFIPEESAGTDRQLRLYLAFVFALFVPTTLVLAWVDWVEGERATAAMVAAISLILLGSFRTLRRARDIRWGYRVVLGSATVLLTLIVYMGGGGGYAVLWYYVFPAGFYYVFGALEGSVWVAVLLAPAFGILFTDLGAAYSPGLAVRVVITYALLSALALGLQRARDALYGELAQEKARVEEALAQVRTLSELLPMCAWCGKVRNDEGYWSRIEEYLRDRTGTLVSHGVCEECAAKLEAELDRGKQASPGSPGSGAPPGSAG